MVVWQVSLEVVKPRTTSTSVITGTGFMKCMPIILSGLCVPDAIRVIEMDDVFDASITPGRTIESIACKTIDLESKFSTIASIMKSASFKDCIWVEARIREKDADLSDIDSL